MKIIQHKLQVPYHAQDLYQLVADIEAYPEFLPWCKSAHILKQENHIVEARLLLSKGGVKKSFTTRNLMTPHSKIEIHLLEGPFKHLYGVWEFEETPERTQVSLRMEFSFDNKFLAMMLEPIFHSVADSLLHAFVERAAQKCQKR